MTWFYECYPSLPFRNSSKMWSTIIGLGVRRGKTGARADFGFGAELPREAREQTAEEAAEEVTSSTRWAQRNGLGDFCLGTSFRLVILSTP